MIEAYIDESGTHYEAPFMTVAAYFAPHSSWSAFNQDWEAILKAHNIECFHAKDPGCDALRPVLAKIIEDRRLKGVITFVSRQVYAQHASAQIRSRLGSAYAACVSQCVFKTCRLAKIYYPGKPVAFFIEAGQPKTEHIEEGLKLMIGKDLDRELAPVGGVALVRKKDFIPLQAADFLSHVYSTQDMDWFNYLARRGLIWSVPIEKQALEKTSAVVKTMIADSKWRPKSE